jgi:glycerate-2-kinase
MRIQNLDTLTSHGNTEGRKLVCNILEAALQAADPYNATKNMLKLEGGRLIIDCPDFEPIGTPNPGPHIFDLDKDFDRVFVFVAGKGMLRVAKALEDVLGDYLTGGLCIVKYGDIDDTSKFEVYHAGHPIPDENCVAACRRMVEMASELRLTERDLVFTGIGNGVGSLLTLPPDGISLSVVSDMIHLMQIEKGVPTAELSIVRNHLDQIKGGRMTRLFKPAKMVHLLAIDCNYGNTGIVGYPGLMRANVWLHTMPECGSREIAIAILKKWDAWDEVDESIRNYLSSPNSGPDVMRQEEFEQLGCLIYGIMPDSKGPLPTAMKHAEDLGYPAHLMCRGHELEASATGRFFGLMGKCIVSEGQPFPAPCAIFYTGEMLVTVGNGTGVGGRNQECAVSAARVIQNENHLVVASVDTDGTDGPGGDFDEDASAQGVTVLSGGIVDGYTMGEAQEKGVDMITPLQTHGTSQPLWKLNCGLQVSQNISLQDLLVMLVMPPKA